MMMSCDDTGTKPVRRFEVFTGAGHRREWSDETRAAIIAESYSGAESVSAVGSSGDTGSSGEFGEFR
jgi:transposase